MKKKFYYFLIFICNSAAIAQNTNGVAVSNKYLTSVDFDEYVYDENGDSCMVTTPNVITFSFDNYLNNTRIDYGDYDRYEYHFDQLNRMIEKKQYTTDYFCQTCYDLNQQNYSYDSQGKNNEIIYYYEKKDNPESEISKYKHKSVNIYFDDNSIKECHNFSWDNTLYMWTPYSTNTYEKNPNYEIDRIFQNLSDGNPILCYYDSTSFNSHQMPTSRIVKSLISDNYLKDVAILNYQYEDDTLLKSTDLKFILTSFDTLYQKFSNNYYYNSDRKLIKHERFFEHPQTHIIKLDEEMLFSYDSIGNLTTFINQGYWNIDTLNFFIRYDFSYDYSELYANIGNDAIPWIGSNLLAVLKKDFGNPNYGYFINYRNHERFIPKPINAISKVSINRITLDSPNNSSNPTYRYHTNFEIRRFNYSILTGSERIIPEISIFPNPSTDFIHFYIYEPFISAIIQVYDINGKIAIQKETQDTFLDISNLQKGFYVIKINVNEKSWVQKFIKK